MATVSPVDEPEKRKSCVTVQSRINFTKIGEIDTKNEKFAAEAYIECTWYDDSILKKFIEINFSDSNMDFLNDLNETKIKFLHSILKKIQYDPELFWSPEIYVENSIGSPKEYFTYKFDLVLTDKQAADSIDSYIVRITEKRRVEGFFYERLELNDFPIDLQELSIKLTSKKSVDEVILVECKSEKSGVNIECFADQQQWDLFDCVKITKNSFDDKWKKYVRSEFKVTCLVVRKYGFYLWNAFLLVFLITVLGFTIFSISPTTPQFRCQVTGLLLLTSINFRWIVTQRLPSVSYLTLLDKYTIGCLIYLVLFCVWHAIIGSESIISNIELKRDVDFYFLIGSAITFIVFHLGFIFWFIRKIIEIKHLKEAIFNHSHNETNGNHIHTSDTNIELE
ncbi:unnamed protein product [Brachionus calyciflorus]|uniref:Neurotransmitter-gated ion-channel ligand-binding domain-containing protein n=1 Tax=Brachionus calyciflorus TaxID=104777 RepID=A0A813WYM2_9BILA|nr:unnamed protein product [Brachionus calyciflorus]